ncbi:zinc finger protein ZXDC [Rhineura floridana]|uniref:zinc finger protein ZXDC n=1 Tax=Rhineura floridana TaxID=261503 RepID=UPI002AC835FE|nr:zinc finger protein ZXDC [Rhineura floridana]
METQGLPAAVEAARPEPGTQQHGGSAVVDEGPSSSEPARRPPQPRDSAPAGAWGLDVTFPVLLLLEGKKPLEPPPPAAQHPLPPPGPSTSSASASTALALPPGAAGPGQPQESDSLLLVLNLVRGGASGSPSRGPSQELSPQQQREEKSSGEGGSEAQASGPFPEGSGQHDDEDDDDGSPTGGSSFSGTLTINNQSLLVRFENGLLSLGGPTAQAPSPQQQQAPPPLSPRPLRSSHADEPPAPASGGPSRTPVSYPCPESRCAETFSCKQLLRLHRLSAHGGSPAVTAQDGGGGEAVVAAASADSGRTARPFCCPVPGCTWAFATAYKLRRHLHSHDKLRPFACSAPGCTKRFTTIYNLRAHGRAHEQEATHKCEACGQRFPSAARLAAHQRRSHLEPDRPYRCEYPGCERTFITVSALFSHNRIHFREQELFSCSFPGCNKQYDKACRLKIHMRSHTGERPFICDFEGCGWSFTSMSKLLRHKRKHEDDRRFTCSVEGCGKSFTRAEHLKGHSITHLGTKPFECPVEGCCAKFSARSSLYIHSKKHLQDVDSKTRCPVSSCNKLFTSKHSMKTHMVKQHNFSADLLNQMETVGSLTPSSELASSGQSDLSSVDLVSLFSSVSGNASGISTDMALINSGILTIDVASVGSTLGGNLSVGSNSLGQAVDPLILVASSDIPHSLDSSLLLGTTATVLQQSTLNLDDVQTVNAEALGSLASLSTRSSSQELHGLTSSNNLSVDVATLTPSSSLGGNSASELLAPSKAEPTLLPSLDVVGQQEGSKVVTQFVFSNPPGSYSAQKETDLSTVTGSSFLESGGSARTDYRAIQLAKKRKQKRNGNDIGTSNSGIRKGKDDKVTSSNHGNRLCNSVLPNGSLTVRDPSAGTQFVQIQLLQDDSPGEGDLPFQLSSQSSSSHSQLTVDLPVHILQEPHNSAEEDASSDNSQFTGSTINLQDLE